MKIGIVSTFLSRCGVSSYTENLVEELKKTEDIKVICNHNAELIKAYPDGVLPAFHAPFLTNQETANVPLILDYLKDRDIIHFQFETNIYHPSYFPELITKLKMHNKLIVFTMHSSGMWREFDTRLVDHWISHSQMWINDLYRHSSLIPMGCKFYDPPMSPPEDVAGFFKSICSFGLGRNNDDILKACAGDNTYRTSYGNSKWLPIKDLVDFIRSNWVISLYYPPTGAHVSSSAVMLALGCDRPIIATDTEWFSHTNYPSIYKVNFNNHDELKKLITRLTDCNPATIAEIREDLNLTKELLTQEKRTYKDFIDKHIEVYKNLLKI